MSYFSLKTKLAAASTTESREMEIMNHKKHSESPIKVSIDQTIAEEVKDLEEEDDSFVTGKLLICKYIFLSEEYLFEYKTLLLLIWSLEILIRLNITKYILCHIEQFNNFCYWFKILDTSLQKKHHKPHKNSHKKHRSINLNISKSRKKKEVEMSILDYFRESDSKIVKLDTQQMIKALYNSRY